MVLNITSPTFAATLPSGYTQAQLTTFMKARFAAAGFPTPTAEVSGATDKVGYDFDFNPSAVYGQFRVTFENSMASGTSTLRLRLHATENMAYPTFTEITNTGANAAVGATFTLSNLNSLLVYAIPTTEQYFGLVVVENGSTFKGVLGVAYPTHEPWYNENSWAGAMLVQPTIPNSFWLPYPNPLGTAAATVVPTKIGISTFATRNPLNNVPQVLVQPWITYHTWGIGGQFGGSIGISNNSGFITNDISIKTAGVEEYWNAWCGDNGVVFRSI